MEAQNDSGVHLGSFVMTTKSKLSLNHNLKSGTEVLTRNSSEPPLEVSLSPSDVTLISSTERTIPRDVTGALNTPLGVEAAWRFPGRRGRRRQKCALR
jgi:hypothetical protein